MAGKKKTASKKSAHKTALSTAKLLTGAIVSTVLVTALAFVSLQLSLTTLAVIAGSAFLLYENNRRGFWEIGSQFKFKRLKDEQTNLSKELAVQRYAIEDIKDDLQKIRISGDSATSAHSNNAPKRTQHVKASPAKPKERHTNQALITEDDNRRRKDPPLTSTPANYDPRADYDGLSDMIVKELIQHAVRESQVGVFVQPIVRLPQRKTSFYEIFARIRAKPGMYLPAARYMALAREDKVMNKVDHLLLMQCLKSIEDTAHLEKAAPLFINITSATLSNALFMKQLLGFLSQKRYLAPRLIFEIQQKEFDDMSPAILEILRGLGRLGCAISIDHVTSLDFDIKFLQVLKVRFVKIDAAELLNHSKNERDFAAMNRLKKRLEGNGIRFIVEKIENERALKEILDFDIHYGQGYLFGKPHPQGVYKKKTS